MLAKKRVQNDDYELYDGRHEAIITEEQWACAKAAQAKRNHPPTHKERHLQNPFASILYCEKCGAIMKRKVPKKSRTCIPWYQCPTRGCDCKMIKCETVEKSIRDAMEEWLNNYIIQINSDQQPAEDPIAAALTAVRGQLAGLQLQQENICEYLEKGIYTVEMFSKRNASLAKEIKQLQTSEADLLRQQSEGDEKKRTSSQLIPTAQHILEHYSLLSVEEKNRLWKLVLKKATVYRTQDDELMIHIYPNLPQ